MSGETFGILNFKHGDVKMSCTWGELAHFAHSLIRSFTHSLIRSFAPSSIGGEMSARQQGAAIADLLLDFMAKSSPGGRQWS